jgi:excinuclease ABC subunit A
VVLENLVIRGAREHNLKNIDVTIPRNSLTVVTGPSGSGKSSLAFDTIYAEGQRRYVESLSAYARQFLEQMQKPNVESIEGLSPAISIDQKSGARNPRSIVGTVTEIYDYLRLLFANVGKQYCYNCNELVSRQSAEQIAETIKDAYSGKDVTLLAPVVVRRKGHYKPLFDKLKQDGYVRVVVDGQLLRLDEPIELDKNKFHTIDVVVDRFKMERARLNRLLDGVEKATGLAEGAVKIQQGQVTRTFSERNACANCGISYEEAKPAHFSFNSPMGACPECQGLGVMRKIDPELIVPDRTKSFHDGAVATLDGASAFWYGQMIETLASEYGIDLDRPWKDLPKDHQRLLLYGTGGKEHQFRLQGKRATSAYEFKSDFEGIVPNLERRYKQTQSEWIREWIETYMAESPCLACKGKRLKPAALSTRIGSYSIADIADMTVEQAHNALKGLALSEQERKIAHEILKELTGRLTFLLDVGLDYLTLSRRASTLSGGESQRIRLATQIGSGLVGVLYILDEPSIGLHQKDNLRLLATLKRLRDLGNTLIVVEHDFETMEAADWLIDLGPGAGEHGGRVVAAGPPSEVRENPASLTGKYLSGKLAIPVPAERRAPLSWLTIKGARQNNLKNIDVKIPLGILTVVTGVSGSGKSTLVDEVLYRYLAKHINGATTSPGAVDQVEGVEAIDKVIEIDQSPIGRTPRSNPVTYTGAFTPIRDLFAGTPLARQRGYTAGRFSFNVKGGRCETCGGDGQILIEMHFLPDVSIPCEACGGKRYNRDTLEVTYKGKNIYDVLNMTVDEALGFFEPIPRIRRVLQTLADVGLGYMRLGQSSTTLSGGEAQRIKIGSELQKRPTGKTFYILDEPTTGLHAHDIRRLIEVLRRLTRSGNTVVVIEHNLDVIKTADWLIDLGPEGGARGGRIVATGTPEEVARTATHTGQFLKKTLAKGRAGARSEEPRAVPAGTAPAARAQGKG